MSYSEAEKSVDYPRINGSHDSEKVNYDVDNKMPHSPEENSSIVTSCKEDNDKFTFSQDDSKEKTNREDSPKLLHPDQTVDEDDDTRCGIGGFKPQWLQRYATPRYFLLLYCAIGLLQGTNYSYFSGCLSTFEKRFAFKSQISGYILLLREMAPLVVGIPISYFGGRSHMPRIVAMGMLMVVISCFVAVLPFLIYGPADHLDRLLSRNETGPEVCDIDSKAEVCEEDDRPPTIAAVTMLALSGVIEGFGGLTYYTIGLAYMDNITSKKNTPFYIAISFALRILGPILGYLMSSVFLNFNENPFDPPDYGPEDPRWIGGWWMGFVLEGSVLLLFTVPLAMFPRRLPSSKKSPPPPRPKKEDTFLQMWAGLIPVLKRLSKNPIYILLTINTTMIAMGNFGHFVILPKYMENQFRLTASDASLYAGPPALAALQIATLLSGFIMWKYRPSAKFLTAGLAISEVVSAVGYLVFTIPKCEKVNIFNAGLTSDGLNLTNQCNSNCMCTTAAYTPVCGPDKSTTYFSPCHAGCTELQGLSNAQEFRNCSCVIDDYGNFTTAESLQKGVCPDENCRSQAVVYTILLPMVHGLTNVLRVAHTVILLRSIHPGDKSAALGAFETLISLFGFMPYPVIFGALVDSACLVWEKTCGQTGNCWFYDMDKFNYALHGMSATFSMLSALCLTGVCLLSSRLRDLYEEEDLDNDDDVKNEQMIETKI